MVRACAHRAATATLGKEQRAGKGKEAGEASLHCLHCIVDTCNASWCWNWKLLAPLLARRKQLGLGELTSEEAMGPCSCCILSIAAAAAAITAATSNEPLPVPEAAAAASPQQRPASPLAPPPSSAQLAPPLAAGAAGATRAINMVLLLVVRKGTVGVLATAACSHQRRECTV